MLFAVVERDRKAFALRQRPQWKKQHFLLNSNHVTLRTQKITADTDVEANTYCAPLLHTTVEKNKTRKTKKNFLEITIDYTMG